MTHKTSADKLAKQREYSRRWRLNNPEKQRAYNARWRTNNPTKYQETLRRSSSKRRNQPYRMYPTPTRECPAFCECCGQSPGKVRLALDHDHATGVFRGWICSRCNTGIGLLGDSHSGVLRAAKYLQRGENS